MTVSLSLVWTDRRTPKMGAQVGSPGRFRFVSRGLDGHRWPSTVPTAAIARYQAWIWGGGSRASGFMPVTETVLPAMKRTASWASQGIPLWKVARLAEQQPEPVECKPQSRHSPHGPRWLPWSVKAECPVVLCETIAESPVTSGPAAVAEADPARPAIPPPAIRRITASTIHS